MADKIFLNHLIINLLSDYNLKCVFCRNRKARQRIMPKNKIIKLINQLQHYQIEYVVFTGGEVTLYKDLLEVINYTKEKLNCRIVINTNGINLNSDMITNLIKTGVDIFKISLHAFDLDIYDQITGISGSYKKLLRNIKEINKIKQKINKKLKIKTNTVVFCNYKDIGKLIDFGFQNDIKSMQFSLADMDSCQRDDSFFNSLNKDELRELYFKIYPKLLRRAINKKIKVEFRPMFVELVGLPEYKLVDELRQSKRFNQEINNYSKKLFGKKFYKKYKCYESFSGIAIMPEGDALFCCSNYKNKIGNIFNDSLEEILLFKGKIQPQGCDRCRLFFSASKEFYKQTQKFYSC